MSIVYQSLTTLLPSNSTYAFTYTYLPFNFDINTTHTLLFLYSYLLINTSYLLSSFFFFILRTMYTSLPLSSLYHLDIHVETYYASLFLFLLSF
jgi:hypothetical protein